MTTLSADTEPRLGLFREGDTVWDDRRVELLRLPNARLWRFKAVGRSKPSRGGSTDHMVFTLVYVGPR